MISVYLNDIPDRKIEGHDAGFIYDRQVNHVAVSFAIDDGEVHRAYRVNFDPVIGRITVFDLKDTEMEVEIRLP